MNHRMDAQTQASAQRGCSPYPQGMAPTAPRVRGSSGNHLSRRASMIQHAARKTITLHHAFASLRDFAISHLAIGNACDRK